MNDYDVAELVKDYQIAERDVALAYDALDKAKGLRDKALKAFGQYLYDIESVAAPDLDGDTVLYYVDEDGEFRQRHIGRVLTTGNGAK